MEAYLNELSMPNFHSAPEVIEAIRNFGDFYKNARVIGVRDIKVPESFFSHYFAPQYTFHEWRRDNRADNDLRTLLMGVFSTLPFANNLFEDYQNEEDTPITMTYNGQDSLGLGLASSTIFDSVAFSFNPIAWNNENYDIAITTTSEDENDNIIEVTEQAVAKNIATQNHLNVHSTFIRDKIASTIQNGRELWARKIDLFPNLDFCTSVRSQLESFRQGDIGFAQVINRLMELQQVASAFDGNQCVPNMFPSYTTPESSGRERDFANELTFMCPDNNYRLFSWHSRFTPGAGRIHFFPFENEQRILVGYVGKKIQ